jgi:hypothetical protein
MEVELMPAQLRRFMADVSHVHRGSGRRASWRGVLLLHVIRPGEFPPFMPGLEQFPRRVARTFRLVFRKANGHLVVAPFSPGLSIEVTHEE